MQPLLNIKNANVIISALDWGFGHTTRCYSIIKQLQENQNTIHFAGNIEQINFFKHEFTSIIYHNLKGYEIKLDESKNTYSQLFKQKRRIKESIKREHTQLQNFADLHHFDFVISDNRYGFYLKNAKSYIICHQLNLHIPFGKKIVNFFHQKLLNNFDGCLIPDYPDRRFSQSLSKAKLKIPSYFIGPLSRFKVFAETAVKFNQCFILSGPEPARSNFLELIENHIQKKAITNCCIIGVQKENTKERTYISSPSTRHLNRIICGSKLIIARAGYTTIMELEAIKKHAILIPTPGQYEQEYFAEFLKIENITFKSENDFFKS